MERGCTVPLTRHPLPWEAPAPLHEPPRSLWVLALGARLHVPQGTGACPRTALKGCEDGIWASDVPKVAAKLGLDTGLILAPNPAPGALPSCRNTNRNDGEVNARRFFLPSLKTRSREDGQGD